MPKEFYVYGWGSVDELICVKFPGGVIYFDAEVNKGLYYNRNTNEDIPFQDLFSQTNNAWVDQLADIGRIAQLAEKEITFNSTDFQQAQPKIANQKIYY
jgi:hypothetical protein